MKYKGLVIADIHIGAFSIEKLYQEFTYQFIDYIKQMKKLDFIIIAGDLFDHKLFLNQKESYYAYRMIQEMIKACPNDIKIRLVYGTESHECNQYSILSTITDTDIRVIKTVEEEELFPDCKVLYLPEEYCYDKKEYYKEYYEKEKEYDYIFGHGVIREAMKMAAVTTENDNSKRKKVPVFTTAELRHMCKGQTFFGHYHVHTEMDDVFYVGSFSRWKYGEEEDKGFYEITCDTEKESYKEKFIVNTVATVYATMRYGYKNNIFKDMDSLDKEMKKIEKLIKTDTMDHMRFQFNIPPNAEKPEFMIEHIQKRFKFDDNIKIEFENGYIEEKKKKQAEEIKQENDKYAFIFDKDMKFENKVAYFISIEYDKKIEVEHVSDYLYKPLNEILSQN